MKQGLRTPLSLLAFLAAAVALAGLSGSGGKIVYAEGNGLFPADTNDPDSALPYPFDEEDGGLYLNKPSNFNESVEYDEETGQYIVTEKIGNLQAKPPMLMTPEEYRQYVSQKQARDYWNAKTQSEEVARSEGRDPSNSLIPQIKIQHEAFSRIFGSNTIDIRPQGYAELRFGGRIQNIDNPLIPERNRSTFTFDFDQRIQMNVSGKIGEKLELRTNYDTEATFNFENRTKVEFTGEEDDIIKKIELGNVSLPLNSTLISGAQSLFGVKGQFQFGKLTLTGVLSEQQSQSSSINIQGGATTTEFEIWGDQYEANRHYFLSHYFRDNYEQFLANMPLVTSPVQITKVEVWVTNTRQETEDTRNILAFMDLGALPNDAYREPNSGLPGPDIYNGATNDGFPDNDVNTLDPDMLEQNYAGVRDVAQVNTDLNTAGFEEAIEYTTLSNARKLRPQEFDFHPQLGYISLNSALNQDEVLAVAFQYTAGGKTYQVGEFSTDGITPPKTLVVKMLKSTILNVEAPMWDLMMKNVYSLNAYQVNAEDFQLEVLYQNDETGTPIPFIPEGELQDQLLLRVVELDRLDNNNDPTPDGFFDFVPGITINPQSAKIIFPVLEPFGENLADKINDPALAEEYVFQELYDSTRFKAQNQTELNKYLLRGQFKSSSSSEISLNAFNIPKESVVVKAGGQVLTENQHYTVDYNLGRVKIIDDGILQSGMPIKVDFENNAIFNAQTKTFMGLNADYKFNDNLNLGATVVRLSEKPLTQKVNIGEEPIANSMWGMNGTYSKEAPYLTRFVDAIPFVETKAPSNLTVHGEFAQLIPGSPRGIEIDDEATTYLDDFESSQTSIDIRNPTSWELASTPGRQPELFPEAQLNGLEYGYNRAKLAWYTIDPLFTRGDARTPDNIRDDLDLQSGQFVREILIEEVFPNIDQNLGAQANNIPVLNLAYYPDERGPYNYVVEDVPGVARGLEEDGSLAAPETRWGGIMRELSTTNFEEQNIEFIQFWMLDPFYDTPGEPDIDNPTQGGDLYFNLGSVSEDILKDGRQAAENGIPSDGNLNKLDSSYWGYAPSVRPVVTAFANDPEARNRQDVGYDLLDDDQERNWVFDSTLSYLDRIANAFGVNSDAYAMAQSDPGADNFRYFRGPALDQANADILERYKYYNNPQGNSDPAQIDGVSAFATNSPDVEDINRDQTLSNTEAYYQYRVSIRPEDLRRVGQNYITDIFETESPGPQPNGDVMPARWVQFKIPVFDPDQSIGPISDFRSIRFIRMLMKNFPEHIVLRFARMELIRGEWRRYTQDLDQFGDELNTDDQDATLFEVNAVNIEQNGSRVPIPYVIPPGIQREVLFSTTALQQQNEQALSLRVCGLNDGAARAVFRNINFDMRMYNGLKMFVHMEDGDLPDDIQAGDINLFIRVGSDYNRNYYEYELPLVPTPFDGEQHTPQVVWPMENNVDLKLSDLIDVKLQRDRDNVPITERYPAVPKGRGFITVKGAPNLSNIRTIMIGVRNPKKRLAGDNDDGLPKCAEVWVNELRLTEFDERGGWAANARVAAQLADFGNVNLSGRMSTIGFGGLDQSVTERQKEERYAYDMQTNVELGKFFSKDAGMRIPMFFGMGEEWATPQFNPLDPDVEMDDALANLETEEKRDELRDIAQDYTRRRSLNFANVRKDRTGKSAQENPMPWDIENFSAGYSFNEVYRQNISIESDLRQDYRGNLTYSYRTNPKPVEPFKNVSWMTGEYFKLIKAFNFNYYPRSFTAIASVDRSINTSQRRNTIAFLYPSFDDPLPVTHNNSFNFNRQYSLLWDLTQSLKLDFNANMRTRVDELVDYEDSTGQQITYTDDEKTQEILNNLKDFGRPVQYHQTLNLNWQVPVDKLPHMDFVGVQARYTGDYDWQANSLRTRQSTASNALNFGNTIQNTRQIQLNTDLNMVGLYNKVPYLKKVNSGGADNRRGRMNPTRRKPGESRAGENQDEEEESIFDKILKHSARTLMMVRSVSGTYSRSEGTLLPGFKPEVDFLGMSTSNDYAPGFWFTLGGQTPDIREQAVDNLWLEQSELLNTQYTETFNESMNFRVTAEPANNLRVILTAQKTESENLSEFFRWDGDMQDWLSQNTFRTQTFTMSYITLGTAFERVESPNFESETYNEFLTARETVSRDMAQRFNNEVLPSSDPELRQLFADYSPDLVGHPDSTNYGYRYFSQTSQQVLIPSFLAAYTGEGVDKFGLEPKKSIPLPNWQITYDGLTKIKWFRNFFNSAVLNHSYRSTYTLGNMTTNLLREQAIQDNERPLDNNGDLLPEFQISSVVITEQFAPLLGLNVKLKNNTTVRLEYKKSRNVSLSLANNQITEMKSTEWVIGAGYIIEDVRLKFVKLGPRRTSPVSNLELKADIGIRDNLTLIRRIVEEIDDPTSGQKQITAKLSGDYRISERVSAKLFYDLNLSRFKTTNAYPITTHQFGISVRLNLGQ